MKPIYRTFHPTVRIIDESKGIADFVASDETLDYYREIVRVAGWKFTNFERNSPVPDSHDYSTIEKLCGKVTDWWFDRKQLVQRVQFAIDVPECKLAALAWKMVVKGYLKACSVGFQPVSVLSKWGDEKAWLNGIRELGLTPEQAASVRTIYWEQEQLELSVCIIGANPSALAKAYKADVLTDSDIEELATLSDRSSKRNIAPFTRTPGRVDGAPGRDRKSFLRNLENQINKIK